MANIILDKLNEIAVSPVNKVALAYSGGLDSILCIRLLEEYYKAKEIILINVNVGQGESEIQQARTFAKKLGFDMVHLDAEKEFIEGWVSKAIRANASYGGYPLATAMTRHLIAQKVIEIAIEKGCDAVAEGTTGKSNDQFRMKNTFEYFGNGLRTIQPIREFDLSREEEKTLTNHYGIEYIEAMYGGDDKTIWCRSLASGAITNLDQIPEDIWIWYKPIEKVESSGRTIELEFSKGIPVSVDGQKKNLKEIIEHLNITCGAEGIGFIDTWEQDVVDVKSREFYEAPAAAVILKAHYNLERICFPKDELSFKSNVDAEWSRLVFNGDWFHPLRYDLDSFIEQSQNVLNGVVSMRLCKGNIRILSCESPFSLYKPEIRSLQSRGFDQRICGPAAELKALPYKILSARNTV